jgi:hypothetical protein
VSWLFNVLLWGASAHACKNRIHCFYEVAQTLAQSWFGGRAVVIGHYKCSASAYQMSADSLVDG